MVRQKDDSVEVFVINAAIGVVQRYLAGTPSDGRSHDLLGELRRFREVQRGLEQVEEKACAPGVVDGPSDEFTRARVRKEIAEASKLGNF